MATKSQNDNLSATIEAYTSYWERIPAPPKTIVWLQKLAEKLKVQWIPDDPESPYASNSYLDSERFHFENMFPALEAREIQEISKNSRLLTAQATEFRSRIYRLIHKGTASDHLMPVEARAYWLPSKRLPKLIFCIVLTVALYLSLLVAPSLFLYDTFLPKDAFLRTYKGPHTLEVQDQTFIEGVRREFVTKLSPVELASIPNSAMSVRSFIALHDLAQKKARADMGAVNSLSSRETWLLSSEESRAEAVSFVIFSELLQRAAGAEEFFIARRLVVTPANNIPEVLTQTILVVLNWVLLTLYLTRKHEFFDVYQDTKKETRSFAAVLCVNLLGSIFRGRQHFHFLIAAFAATVALCVHFFYIGKANTLLAMPVAELVRLTPYDYRLATDLQPVYLVHWIFQFTLVFLFVLFAWEVAILGRCLRTFQLHLLKEGAFPDAKWTESNNLAGRQKTARLYIVSIFVGLLVALGFWKSWPNSAFLDFWTRMFRLDWAHIAQSFYYFSPALLVWLMMAFAMRPIFENETKARAVLNKRDRKQSLSKQDDDFIAASVGRIPGLKKLLKKGDKLLS